jgi:GrpB-like predicted nucleotidyltransferase (UPF0157 family)
MSLVIKEYINKPAECTSYDPIYPQVASCLINFIQSIIPEVAVYHVGSTSIPGCDGKGIIDILIVYRLESELNLIKNTLKQNNFQEQTTSDPFPEERPMRTGSFEYFGRIFRTHIHIIEIKSKEINDLLKFKEILTLNNDFKKKYIITKKKIIENGITNSLDYCHEKRKFIEEVMQTNGI